MLYSHLRFFIAGIEMPVSGQIYVTGGTLNTTLTYTLFDTEMFNASPMARTRFEDVPVRLAGLPPTVTIADDERKIESGTADGDYIVLFDGTASLTISYSPDTKRVDIGVTAIPGTVKALNSIVYTSLSVGSMTGSVAGAQDTVMTKNIAEASGSQVLNTGFGPNNLNTNMFLKRVVAGEKTKEISRPTDMLEFAISNILKYAGASFMKTGNNTPLLFDSADRNFSEVYLANNDNRNKAADLMPGYLKEKWSARIGKPDHGDTEYVYDPSQLSMVLPDFIFRGSIADDLIQAAKTTDPQHSDWAELSKEADYVKMRTELTRTASFLGTVDGGLWFGYAKELAYLFTLSNNKLQGYKNKHCLPKCIADALVNASPAVAEHPEVKKIFDELAEVATIASKHNDQDSRINKYQDMEYARVGIDIRSILKRGSGDLYDAKAVDTANYITRNYWRFYGPEFVAILNAFMKSYLTTLGLAAVSYVDKNTTENILKLLYTEETSKDFPQFHKALKNIVAVHITEIYPQILADYYNGMTHVFAQTYSPKVFEEGYNMTKSQFSKKKDFKELYMESLHPTEAEWAHMQAKGNLTMDIPSTMHTVANNRDPETVAGSYVERLQNLDQARAWYSMLRDFIISGIKSASEVLTTLRSECETGMVIGYTFTSSFYSGKYDSGDTAKSLNLAHITDLLHQVDSIITELNPDKPYVSEVGDPSLFDIKAAHAILSRAAQNKVGSIDFMRLSTEDKKDAAVYPNLALASLQEFQQLVSNTSQAAGNGNASLYQMLVQLYSTLRLSLTNPLNKPYAIQHNKAIDSTAEVVDGTKSVLEMMVLPSVETWAVPKCNVFCVDRSLPVVMAYNQLKNVTDILIRYSEPVDIITGTNSGGTLPATYYRFSLQNPGKVYKVADPKAAFADNRSYDQVNDASGYKSGYVYDMYSTATIDVSQEVAALAKLCSKPKEPEPNAEAIAAAEAQVPASLKFSLLDIGSAINRANLNVLPSQTLTIAVKSEGTADSSKTGGYQYKSTEPGSECEYETSNQVIGNLAPKRRKDGFKQIYEAVCFQVTLNYLSKHIANLRRMASVENKSEDEIRNYISTSIFSDWKPQTGNQLYDSFKEAAFSFISDYMYKEFPTVRESGEMPQMKYSGGTWYYAKEGTLWDSKIAVYTTGHFDTFITQLLSPDARTSAEELFDTELWMNALTKISTGDAIRREAAGLAKGASALWVLGSAKYTTNLINYSTDDFYKIFSKPGYLKSSLGPAYDHSGEEEGRVKTDDFFKAMSGSSIDVYFEHNYIDPVINPSAYKFDTTDLYKEIILPVRQNIMHGFYRAALSVYGYYEAVTNGFEKNVNNEQQIKPVYTRDLLNNIIQLTWSENHGLLVTKIHRRSASQAAYLTDKNPTVNDSLFNEGKEFELRLDGLLCEEKDLKSWVGDAVWSAARTSIQHMGSRQDYTISDSPYLSYLLYNAAYIHIKQARNEGKLDDAYMLVTPYYYLEKTEDTKPEVLPKMPSISMTFTDEAELTKLKQQNKGNIFLTEADKYGKESEVSKKIAKSDYNSNKKPVLIAMGTGSDLRTERWRVKAPETYQSRRQGQMQIPDWCPRRWPFVVWFDRGTKAGLIYYDMLDGGYSDLLSFGGIVQDNAFQPPIHYFDLDNANGNEAWTTIGDIKVVFDEIKHMQNPFKLNLNAFTTLKNSDKTYVISPIRMDDNFAMYLACINIPVLLLMYHLGTTDRYTDLIQTIDPRGELGAYLESRINQAIKFSEGAVPKTQNRTEDTSSGAGAVSDANLKSELEYSFKLLFQGDWNKACLLPSAGNFNRNTGLRVDKGKTWAKAAKGTSPEDLVADTYDLRYYEGDIFRVHGGVDIGINGYSSTGDEIKDNWVNNPHVPNQIHAPYDVKAVYSIQESGDHLAGYGFYTILMPDSEDQDLTQVGVGEDDLPVILIAHMTPPTTVNLNHFRALTDSSASALVTSTPKITDQQRTEYSKLIALPCSATKADTYYFQDTKYGSAAVKNAGLADEAKNYMTQLRRTFSRYEKNSLSKVIFRIPTSGTVGCIGSSGSSQGLHYHVGCFMIPKSHPAVKRFYSNSVASGIIDWTMSCLYNKTKFGVPGRSCENWSIMSAKRNEVITKIFSECKFQNIHKFLSIDSTKQERWLNGMPDIIPSLSDHDMSQANNLYTVPDNILVSVVESRAYQEAVNRLCTVQVDPVLLPYYDPYVMDGSMPAAVIYRNDVVLTKATTATVSGAQGRYQTSVMFTTGISVAKMLPLYFSALSHLLERNSSASEMSYFISDSVVFPFHSLDFYNKYAYSRTRSEVYYKEMFGKDNFVFDWRDCVRIVVDKPGVFYSVKEIVAGMNSGLIRLAAKRSYSTDNNTLQIDVSGAMSSVRAPDVLPKNQEQLLLTERAWAKDHLFRLSMVKTDPSYMIDKTPAVPLTEDVKLGDESYEELAKENLETAIAVNRVADLPGMYYDWPSLFTKLRSCIRTSRRNVSG